MIQLNPSPSKDVWFENKENIDELNSRIADIDSGKAVLLDWDEVKKQL